MSFGDIFRHMSPLYDAATGFKGTAAKNAMMVLGGKAMGGMGGGQGGMGQMNPQQMMNMMPKQESPEEKRRKMLIDALMRSGYNG